MQVIVRIDYDNEAVYIGDHIEDELDEDLVAREDVRRIEFEDALRNVL